MRRAPLHHTSLPLIASKKSEGNDFSGHHGGPKAQCSLFPRLMQGKKKILKPSNRQNLEADFLPTQTSQE